MIEALSRIQKAQEHLAETLKSQFPDHTLSLDKIGEAILWLKKPDDLVRTLIQLKKNTGIVMDRLSDVTAYDNIDKADGPKRFVMVYQLYSLTFHSRMRVKVLVDENEEVPTIVGLWQAANWLEREVFDLFGIRFRGHPDLRRILMDERFVGHPLRKDYGLKERQPFPDSLPVRIIDRKPVPNDEGL